MVHFLMPGFDDNEESAPAPAATVPAPTAPAPLAAAPVPAVPADPPAPAPEA